MRYDYKCEEHGYFELNQPVADHARGDCPTCGKSCKQVIRSAPALDVWGMAKVGMPGAHEKVGNDMEKRHKAAGQDHHWWREARER